MGAPGFLGGRSDADRPAPADEREVLRDGDVSVTTGRLTVGAHVYELRNADSATITTTKSRWDGRLQIRFGIVYLLGGIAACFAVRSGTPASGGTAAFCLVLGSLLLLIGFWRRRTSRNPTYHLRLATSSGQQEVMRSPDAARTGRIAAAVTEAIAACGQV